VGGKVGDDTQANARRRKKRRRSSFKKGGVVRAKGRGDRGVTVQTLKEKVQYRERETTLKTGKNDCRTKN